MTQAGTDVIDLTGPDAAPSTEALSCLAEVAETQVRQLTLEEKQRPAFETCGGRECKCTRGTAVALSRDHRQSWKLSFQGAVASWRYRAHFQLANGQRRYTIEGKVEAQAVTFDCYDALCADRRFVSVIAPTAFDRQVAQLQITATKGTMEHTVYRSCWIKLAEVTNRGKRSGEPLAERPAKRARTVAPVAVARLRCTLADRLTYYKHLAELTEGRDSWAVHRSKELAAELATTG